MPIPLETKRINRSSMRDEVYETLLDWIMEGKLRPGEKLLDKELAENLGISRTPVREALRRLEDKNLVEASANRWTRVSKITTDEAELIYPIIWTLESLAILTAAPHLTPSDYRQMEKANEDLKQAIDQGNPLSASKADAHFHDIYIQKTNNPHLISILSDLKIKHRRLEMIYFEGCSCASESVNEHNRILKALKTKNLEQAENLILSNWKSSLKRLRTNLCEQI